jgi:hypothetical protein
MAIQPRTLQSSELDHVHRLLSIDAIERRRYVIAIGEADGQGVPGLFANPPGVERAKIGPGGNVHDDFSQAPAYRLLMGGAGKPQGLANGFMVMQENVISISEHSKAVAALAHDRQAGPATIEAAILLRIFFPPRTGDSLNPPPDYHHVPAFA